MRKYETIVIFHPEFNKDQLSQEIDKVKDLLTTNGGEEIEISQWGKKEIAYVAKKQTTGWYVCFKFQSANYGIVEVLASVLRIAEKVLKFQTHRINEHLRKFQGNPKRLLGTPEGAAAPGERGGEGVSRAER